MCASKPRSEETGRRSAGPIWMSRFRSRVRRRVGLGLFLAAVRAHGGGGNQGRLSAERNGNWGDCARPSRDIRRRMAIRGEFGGDQSTDAPRGGHILPGHKGTQRCEHVNEVCQCPRRVLLMVLLPTSGAGGRARLPAVASVTVKRFLEDDCWIVSSIGHLPPVFSGAPAVNDCPGRRNTMLGRLSAYSGTFSGHRSEEGCSSQYGQRRGRYLQHAHQRCGSGVRGATSAHRRVGCH